MVDTDVLVVGLGSAGAAVARALAAAGRRVLAIDKRELGSTGARWVNAVPAWCFERAHIEAPKGHELFVAHEVRAAHAFHLVAPDGKSRLRLEAPPILHVDMRALVDRLVREAREAGVETRRARVGSIELQGDRVVGVHLDEDGRDVHVRAQLVVDASGIGGAIRSRVPQLATICPPPEPESRCVAAQYQYEVRDMAALERFLAEQGARRGDDVAFPGTAGGFSTLTVFTSAEHDLVGILAGSIPAIGVADAPRMIERFVASQAWVGARRWGGRGAIPIRRPYRVLARAGVALVGDAACQVHAAHGSGVGMGLVAGRILAESLARADDVGAEAPLHAYERELHREVGGVLAAADAFRRHVQGASTDDLSALLAEGLLDASLAMDALVQRPTRPSPALAMRMASRATRSPRLALGFLPLAARSTVLEGLGRLVGSARVGAIVERGLERLVGEAPARAGEGAWLGSSSPDAAGSSTDGEPPATETP